MIVTCPTCGGEGMVPAGYLVGSRDGFDPPFDPGATCDECNGCGWIDEEPEPIHPDEFFEDYAPAVGEPLEEKAQ